MKCVIIGAGNYSNVLYNYMLAQNEQVEIVGFVDDNKTLHGTEILGKPVLGSAQLLYELRKTHQVEGVYCPIGNNAVRVKFLKLANELGYQLPNFIHQSSVVGPNVNMGKGIYIMPGTVIMPNATLSNYCMISMCISIGHDTFFEEGVFVANGCNIGGNIHFKKDTFVGMGATIISGVKMIGEKCVIGAGTVIIKDVPDFSVIVGNPGKVIKQTI